MMNGDDYKVLLALGLWGGVSTCLGVVGLLEKDERKKKSSVHMNINFLLTGGTLLPIFIVCYWYFILDNNQSNQLSKNLFYMYMVVAMVGSLLLSGIHGLCYRKKIKDDLFLKFSYAEVTGALILLIGLFFFVLFWGWPK